MIERIVEIRNRAGLHTRPAALLVKLAADFQAEIFFLRDGLRINGKSIIGVMTLAAERGAKVTIQCSGPDEQAATDAIAALIESGFGEEL
jgi:phosphocarrier protein